MIPSPLSLTCFCALGIFLSFPRKNERETLGIHTSELRSLANPWRAASSKGERGEQVLPLSMTTTDHRLTHTSSNSSKTLARSLSLSQKIERKFKKRAESVRIRKKKKISLVSALWMSRVHRYCCDKNTNGCTTSIHFFFSLQQQQQQPLPPPSLPAVDTVDFYWSIQIGVHR